MNRPLPREDDTPWYRQFWPWFLIGLPAIVVVASISTLIIAVEGADDLVDDQYYKDGLAINRELAQLTEAEKDGIRAQLRIDGSEVVVDTTGPVAVNQLRLRLSHPMEANLDFQLTLLESVPGEYRGRLASDVGPRWHWTLEPASGELQWRLAGTLEAADFAHHGGS